MRRLAAVLTAGVLAAAAAAGPPPGLAVPADRAARAKELAAKLGSPGYAEREAAAAELGKMGRDARAALADVLVNSASPEARARAARLLPRAAEADLAARIDAFVADPDGKYDHDLPAWPAFKAQVGSDKPARLLFAELFKEPDNRELLVALSASPRAAGQAVSNRRMALYLAQNPGAFGGFQVGSPRQPRQPTLADVATLLFVEAAVPPADAVRGGFAPVNSSVVFAQQAVSTQAATNPGANPHGEPYRKLLFHWLDTRTQPEDLGPAVNLAQQLAAARDMTPLLRRAVTTDGVQGHYRGQALHRLFTSNRKGEAAFVRSQLKNAGAVTQVFLGPNPGGGAVQVPCQVRDVALALLIADAGQNIYDYGFETQPGVTANVLSNQFPQYAFPTDEARTAAMRKWAEWEARNPPAKEPDPKR